jgi:uncharacterized protein YegP (UPF0339 family)
MPGWFEIKKSSNGQFYFNLKAANSEVILTSEMYVEKASAKGGIASVQKNSPMATRYAKLESKSGKFYFTLKAGNHQVIGNSQMYANEKSRNEGIASVKTNGKAKEIKDLS